jgi:hypothetical protein
LADLEWTIRALWAPLDRVGCRASCLGTLVRPRGMELSL